MPVVKGGQNLSTLVGIVLTDLKIFIWGFHVQLLQKNIDLTLLLCTVIYITDVKTLASAGS